MYKSRRKHLWLQGTQHTGGGVFMWWWCRENVSSMRCLTSLLLLHLHLPACKSPPGWNLEHPYVLVGPLLHVEDLHLTSRFTSSTWFSSGPKVTFHLHPAETHLESCEQSSLATAWWCLNHIHGEDHFWHLILCVSPGTTWFRSPDLERFWSCFQSLRCGRSVQCTCCIVGS